MALERDQLLTRMLPCALLLLLVLIRLVKMQLLSHGKLLVQLLLLKSLKFGKDKQLKDFKLGLKLLLLLLFQPPLTELPSVQ